MAKHSKKEENKLALTRKMLSAMEIPEEKIDEIINAHVETVNTLKEERDGYKAKAEKLDATASELEKVKRELSEVNKEDAYKVKYEALKEEFADFKSGIEAEKTKDAKMSAYKNLLKEIGISEKRIDAVARLAELDKITLNDGKIEGADELKKSLAEEWADFIQTSGKEGAETSNPPAKNGGGTKTKEEIMAIKDTAARQQAMLENKSLFI